jgi:hypothetical protein
VFFTREDWEFIMAVDKSVSINEAKPSLQSYEFVVCDVSEQMKI